MQTMNTLEVWEVFEVKYIDENYDLYVQCDTLL